MINLVFMLEEPSAEAMLQGLLPRLLPENIYCRYVVFEGKYDLEKNLMKRIRGYLVPNSFFVILQDQDSSDCKELKKRLVQLCKKAGKTNFIVRIACKEIESWYIADLGAVECALDIKNLQKKYQNRKPYNNPDFIVKPSQLLDKITKGKYQKVSGSRSIGPELDLNNNMSRSFTNFIKGIKNLIN